MAILNIDTSLGKVYILLEDKDLVHIKEGDATLSTHGSTYLVGSLVLDMNADVVVMKGSYA